MGAEFGGFREGVHGLDGFGDCVEVGEGGEAEDGKYRLWVNVCPGQVSAGGDRLGGAGVPRLEGFWGYMGMAEAYVHFGGSYFFEEEPCLERGDGFVGRVGDDVHEGAMHFMDLVCPVAVHVNEDAKVGDGMGWGNAGNWFGVERPAEGGGVSEGGAVGVAACDVGFARAEAELVEVHEGCAPVVHAGKGREGVGCDPCVIAVAPGGDGSTSYEVAPNLAIAHVEFVHDEGEEEGGEGASLLDAFAHIDERGGLAWRGGAHGQPGVGEAFHDHGDEGFAEVETAEGAFNAGPWESVVRFGDVVVDGVACVLCRALWRPAGVGVGRLGG